MKLKFALALVIVVIATALLLPVFWEERPSGNRRPLVASIGCAIAAALKQYQTDYGEYPHGDYAHICRTLLGDNPHHIVFLEFAPKFINPPERSSTHGATLIESLSRPMSHRLESNPPGQTGSLMSP